MTDERAARIAEFIEPLRVRPGRKVDLAHDFDPGYRSDRVRKKKDGVELLRAGITLLADYQSRLAAQNSYGMLVCLQALDAGGKDGTIRHVMSGVNPQGVHVNSSGSRAPPSSGLTSPPLPEHVRLARIDEIGVVGRVAPEQRCCSWTR